WYLLTGQPGRPRQPYFQLAALPQFIWIGVAATLDGLTGIGGAAAVLLIGTIILAIRLDLLPRRPRYSVPWAMAAGAILFFLEVGYGRIGAGTGYATGSRSLYIGVVSFLPLIAIVLAPHLDTTPAR